MKNGRLMLICLTLAFLMAPQARAQQVRNLKEVISGAFARSGTTHQKPFDDAALVGLCNQGYSLAVYVYAGGRNAEVTCGGGRKLTYLNITRWQDANNILSRADSVLQNGDKVLVHCWNGIHASKYVAAAALNRYCGFSGEQAAAYFRRGIGPRELPARTVEKLSNQLRALGRGGSVMQGCPSPQ